MHTWIGSVRQNSVLKSTDKHRITLIKSKQWFTTKLRQHASDCNEYRSSHGRRARHRLLILLDSASKWQRLKILTNQIITHGLVHKKGWVTNSSQNVIRENGFESGSHPAVAGQQCDVTLDADFKVDTLTLKLLLFVILFFRIYPHLSSIK